MSGVQGDEIVLNRRDPLFYWETATFLVEGTLFKVPRKPLEVNSIVFSDMFALPAGEEDRIEGNSDDHPIHLESIKSLDFQRLLWTIFSSTAPKPPFNNSEEWTSVLKLSTMWSMPIFREVALARLSQAKLDSLTKISLGREYGVKKWILEGYTELVTRDIILSADECSVIGWPSALLILGERENTWKNIGKERDFSRVSDNLEYVFRNELEDATRFN